MLWKQHPWLHGSWLIIPLPLNKQRVREGGGGPHLQEYACVGQNELFSCTVSLVQEAVVIGAIPDVPLSGSLTAQHFFAGKGHPGGKGSLK